MKIETVKIAGIVLAGGRSSRMGQEKLFVSLGQRPVLAHVLERFAPQVGPLALSANGDAARFASFDLPVLADHADHQDQGPLAGLLAGLAFARAQGATHLATVPGDAPFLPRDLVATLTAALSHPNLIAIARGAEGLEPMFALWPVALEADVQRAYLAGERAIYKIALAHHHKTVRFESATAFFNLNTPEDVVRAEGLLGIE